MPVILDPNSASRAANRTAIQSKDFKYGYPGGLNLKPGSKIHDKLRDEILLRARESSRVMAQRRDEWRRMDKLLRVFVPSDVKVKEGANKSGPKKREDVLSSEWMPKMIMPTTYANMETLLTYMVAAFLQNPIFKFEGSGPEDMVGAELLTSVVNHQAHKNAFGLALHTMWRDSFAYGIGVLSPSWHRKFGHKLVVEESGFLDILFNAVRITEKERKRTEWGVLYEGNRLTNIDPYSFLPDPSVAAHEIQEADYVGWVDSTSLMRLLGDEANGDGDLFNVKYLKELQGTLTSSIRTWDSVHGKERTDWDRNTQVSQKAAQPADVIWMEVTLVPSDYELSGQDDPRKWVFALAADEIIISAKELDLIHGDYNVVVCAPDYDGYSTAPTGHLRIVEDLQNTIDFLYSSHIQNVRKSINDMIVVDPSVINVWDLADPKPGKIIRKRRAAWGRGTIDDHIKQLAIQDITQGHVQDADYLMGLMRHALGTEQNLQGMIGRKGPRVSASEFQGARSSGIARLEKVARIMSLQAMIPLANQLASHTQQFMDEDLFIRLTGEAVKRLPENVRRKVEANRLRVTPLDLVVEYDVIAHDGTIPGAQDASLWIEVFSILSQNPIVSQRFDLVKVFKHLAKQMGAKNVDDFELEVMEDEDVEQQVQQGNLIPASEVGLNGLA